METIYAGSAVGGYAGKLDFWVKSGDTFGKLLRFLSKDEEGNYTLPIDLSTYTFIGGMRYPATGYTAPMVVTKKDVPGNNEITVEIDEVITKEISMFPRLNWDLQISDAGGIKTVLSGFIFPIEESVD